jgi:hypothetical protein
MDILDDSILQLWEMLDEYEVKYIMFSGFPVKLEGLVEFNQDLDLLIENSTDNFRRFGTALYKCNIFDFISAPEEDRPSAFTSVKLEKGMELDIYTALPGFEAVPFSQLLQDAYYVVMDELSVPFLNYKKWSNKPG